MVCFTIFITKKECLCLVADYQLWWRCYKYDTNQQFKMKQTQ